MHTGGDQAHLEGGARGEGGEEADEEAVEEEAGGGGTVGKADLPLLARRARSGVRARRAAAPRARGREKRSAVARALRVCVWLWAGELPRVWGVKIVCVFAGFSVGCGANAGHL